MLEFRVPVGTESCKHLKTPTRQCRMRWLSLQWPALLPNTKSSPLTLKFRFFFFDFWVFILQTFNSLCGRGSVINLGKIRGVGV